MMGAAPRLGDLIDDHCPRCRLLLNHAIASMMEGKVAKVICQTCLTEHAYLYQDGAKRKKPPGGRETLFDQILAHGGLAPQPVEVQVKKKKASPATRSGRKPKKQTTA
ncbi:MAG TPA: hypothetical protein VKV95_19490 [Terriglobia bacterium]|nr:hypothetical protein [Terriglobia bacterium]